MRPLRLRGAASVPPAFPPSRACLRAACGLAAHLLVVLAWLAATPHPAFAAETARVVEVVDGDTVRVRTADGAVRPVRLIGIDAPEKGHPAKGREFRADEAARRLAQLCDGKNVRLERGEEDADKYGRLLRYVFAPSPGGKGGELFVNVEMVRAGDARVMRRFPFSRQAAFDAAEADARRQGQGIWADAGMAELAWLRGSGARPVEIWPAAGGRFIVAYGGMARTDVPAAEIRSSVDDIVRLRAEYAGKELERKAREAGFVAESVPGNPSARAAGVPGEELSPPAADAPPTAAPPRGPAIVPWEEAASHVGKTVTVQGQIVRTKRSKNALFLNFHPNWKRYLTIVILGKDLRRFPPDAESRYRDRVIRVTGEVALYNGRPEIVVRSPAALVVVR